VFSRQTIDSRGVAMNPKSANPAATKSWTRALALMSRKHFSPYKAYVRRELKLGVCLNPKVGTTTFRKVLVEGMQIAGMKPILSRLWPLNLTRRYTTSPPNDILHALVNAHQYRFHCFVRNPYARVLSAWNDKFGDGHKSGKYARSMVKLIPVVRRFAAEQGLPGSEENTLIPFTTFLSYVESQDEGTRNQHWDTQRSVLFSDLIQYDRVYTMEDEFALGVADILEEIGIPRSWVEKKLERPENASRKINEPVYTDEIAERVFNIYRDDFSEFGYDIDSWQKR
jgi:hypothetical protein